MGPAAAARTTPTKKIPEAEKVAKNILEILKYAGIETCSATSVSNSSMAKAIVERALLRVGEYRVSFGDFLELFLGFGLVRISVGVILQRKLAIGAFDLLIAGRANYAQYLVIVAFSVTGQNGIILLCLEYSNLLFGVFCYLHHRGTKQTIFKHVPTLQFLKYRVIVSVSGFHQFDGLVKMRIEGFTLGLNGTEAKLG